MVLKIANLRSLLLLVLPPLPADRNDAPLVDTRSRSPECADVSSDVRQNDGAASLGCGCGRCSFSTWMKRQRCPYAQWPATTKKAADKINNVN